MYTTYLEMTGEITAMDTPMTFALGAETNFTFVTVAAGGAMFAISEAGARRQQRE